jgi:hypothetical protein
MTRDIFRYACLNVQMYRVNMYLSAAGFDVEVVDTLNPGPPECVTGVTDNTQRR